MIHIASSSDRCGSAGLRSSLLLLLILVVGTVQGDIVDDAFQPEAELVSDPDSPVVDFEPETVGYQFTWVDSDENLWVGDIDRETGLLVPPDGRGTLLDTHAARPREFLNGPEWALDVSGPVVVYTRKTAAGPRLGQAYVDSDGWVAEMLGAGVYRYGPYGSLDPGDADPRIFYKGPSSLSDPDDPAEAFYWRSLNNPGSETKFGDRISPTRWIPGFRQILYTAIPDGTADRSAQVYLYDIDSANATQITNGVGSRASPRVWSAPDFGERRLMAVARDRDVLEIYLERTAGVSDPPQWKLLRELVVPEQSVGPYIYNARPFVHEGASYIVMLAMECRDSCDGGPGRRGGLTDVWLVGSLRTEPEWRRISDDVPAFREDPETIEIGGRPFTYIYRFAAIDGSPPGIYKLSTGL